jgi:hypothetical protein
MAALKSFVAARHEILKCNLRIGINEDTFATLSEKAAGAIMEASNKAALTADCCASILGDVVDGPMLQKDKEAVVAQITLKMETSSQGQVLSLTPHQAMQDWQHIGHYFTEAQWAVFSGNNVQLSSKIDACMQHTRRLGLVHPTEKTVAVLAAMCLGQAVFTMSPKQCLEVVHLIKAVNKSFTLHGTAPAQSVEHLPENPQEFKAMAQLFWNAAFGDSQPVPNPISPVVWASIVCRIPCRSTRAGAKAVPYPIARGSSFGDIQIEYLQPAKQRVRAVTNADCNLQFPMHGSAEPRSWSPMSPQLLALPAPPPMSPPTTTPASDSQIDEVAAAASPHHQGPTPLEQMVEAMRNQMKPHVAAEPSRDANSCTAAAAAKPAVAMKRPAAAPAVKLGCSKCRFSAGGCKQCRNPLFMCKRSYGKP